MNNKEHDDMWTNLWWLSRVIVGYVIHIVLVVFAIYNIELVFEFVTGFYSMNPEYNVKIPVVVSALILTTSTFFANMAGAYWVKQMYIKQFLPELMDELTKKLLLK